ncbi:MAG: T9SS type A sorting domain-containing protein [Bacteroidetes bacterium]|nr:T9SS type A sorting domain-containing protein [Bacteroidota bacterium]
MLNVKANDNIENIAIYNLLGQKVISQNINAFTSNINITSLTTGLYILKANINGKSGSYKLIKR